MKYYIVVTEWLYPTESGRNVFNDYDTKEEALTMCAELVRTEKHYNFTESCKCDPSPANAVTKDGKTVGFLVTDKNGIENWWYCAKVVEVEYGLEQMD